MRAVDFLQTFVDLTLCYGIKSPDTELYDFCFSEAFRGTNLCDNKSCTHILHALCRFKVIWRNGESRVDKYYEDTPYKKFCSEVKCLLGRKVRRITLSGKNDLWIDFGDFWIVFVTFEDGEESWRLFTTNDELPHLVASNSWLDFSK